jgi:AcrR family transcriptional regulator
LASIVRAKSGNHKLVARQRERIARAALSLYIKRGFRNTGVQQVAKAARMSAGNLYHYINSSEDILSLVVDLTNTRLQTELKEILRSTEPLNPAKALASLIKSAYQLVDRNQDFIMFMFQETRHLTPKARKPASDLEFQIISFMEDLLRKGCESGDFNIEGDIRTFAHDVLVMIEMWSLRRWFYNNRVTLEDHIRIHTCYILRCICKNKDI